MNRAWFLPVASPRGLTTVRRLGVAVLGVVLLSTVAVGASPIESGVGDAPVLQVTVAEPETRLATTQSRTRPASWVEAGERYRRGVGELSEKAASVREVAERLTGGVTDPEKKLEILLSFVRTEIEYLFVGDRSEPYRPSRPMDVLARGWGDCKDKTYLLLELLAAAGIEASPLLVTMAPTTLVDPKRPTLSPFDHVMVAATVGGRLYFLEPSQRQGGLVWLHPGLQDRRALLVDPGSSRLVTTPTRAAAESREAAFVLDVDDLGRARGTGLLRLLGAPALSFLDSVAPSGFTEEGQGVSVTRTPLRQVLDLEPFERFAITKWRRRSGQAPAVDIEVSVELDVAVGKAPDRFLELPTLFGLVRRQEQVREGEAIPLPLGSSRTSWKVRLPEQGCWNDDGEISVGNELGRFEQRGRVKGSVVLIERDIEIRQPRANRALWPALRELSRVAAAARHRPLVVSCASTE